MQEKIFAAIGGKADLDSFVEQIQNQAGLRHSIRQLLAERAVQPENPPGTKAQN